VIVFWQRLVPYAQYDTLIFFGKSLHWTLLAGCYKEKGPDDGG
jgi:hypothetical protein